MWLFQSLVNSFYNFHWLKEQRQKPGRAWGYFLLFTLVLSLAVVIPGAKEVPRVIGQARTFLTEKIPDFQAEFKSGELNITGIEQPYLFEDQDGVKIVVDTVTTSPVTLSDYGDLQGKSGFLLTKTKLEVHEPERGKTQIQDLSQLPDFTFTKKDAVNFADKFFGPMKYAIIGFLFLFFYGFMLIGRMFYLLFVSLIAFIVVKIAKRGWKYSEIYTVGLYAVTLPSIVHWILILFAVTVPFLYTIIFFVILFRAIFVKDKEEISTPAPSSSPTV